MTKNIDGGNCKIAPANIWPGRCFLLYLLCNCNYKLPAMKDSPKTTCSLYNLSLDFPVMLSIFIIAKTTTLRQHLFCNLLG